MKLSYDLTADAVRVRLTDKPYSYTDDVSSNGQYDRGVDYADDDTPIAVEFLNVSRGVDLTDIPCADDVARLLEAHGIRVLDVRRP